MKDSRNSRVNPLSGDQEWLEEWLESLGCKPIEWFNGVGSGWTMPFPRGKAEGEVKSALAALHETGRLTRQEAVSMLPVLALDPKPGEYVLDLCASPGSKTSQIAEHLNDSGVVVANEIVRGRVNLLVSNMQRHRSRSNIIVNHDAVIFPKFRNLDMTESWLTHPAQALEPRARIPMCGLDGSQVVVVQCRGSKSTF